MTKVWSTGASSLSVEQEGCVTVARFVGTLTAKHQGEASRALVTYAADSSAYVIDLRKAWVAASASELASVVVKGAKPVALIVPADLAGFYNDFAWQAALRGVVRSVFTAQEPAVTWARREAALSGTPSPSRMRKLTA